MKRLKSLVPILIFLIGAGIFLYPKVANGIALYQQSKIIYEYETKLDESSVQEIAQAKQDAITYNENLAGDPVHDPFVLNSGFVLPENYTSVLNLSEDGVMCSIEIPKISVDLPVYHGASEEVLEKGVGHIEGSSLPIGGNSTHSILCAHRGLPSSELFSRLDELETGDLFYINILNEIHAYRVDQIVTIEPEEISEYLQVVQDQDMITLMTCTPYGINTHRLLVRAVRTEYIPEEKEEIKDESSDFIIYVMMGVIFLLFICIVITVIIRNKVIGNE